MSEPIEPPPPIWEANNPEPGSGDLGTPENPWPPPPESS